MNVYSKETQESYAVEDEMAITWDSAEDRSVKKILNNYSVKQTYYQRPVGYQDVVSISVLTFRVKAVNYRDEEIHGRFLVTYTATGMEFLFETWEEALAFRKSRAGHLRAGYRASGE